jgi:1,4-dihydroxy-2-naphthoate octaprenyltransferase
MSTAVKHWIFLTRPWSYPASAIPALTAISYIFFRQAEVHEINWFFGLLALAGAVIFQAGSNAINDYFDFIHHVDTKDSLGINRLLTDGILDQRSVLRFGTALLIAGTVLGLILLLFTGWNLLWIGITGLLSAFYYYKMKYIALGDLLIFIIYGPLIGMGTAFVMTSRLVWDIIPVTIPVALLVVNILHANNTRDINEDRKANIKTQAIFLGEKGSKIQYIILAAGSYAAVVAMVAVGLTHPLTLSVFLTFPVALKNIKQMLTARIENPELIMDLDANSAKLVLFFGILYSLSNLIASWL